MARHAEGPFRKEYYSMVLDKTGGLFRLAVASWPRAAARDAAARVRASPMNNSPSASNKGRPGCISNSQPVNLKSTFQELN